MYKLTAENDSEHIIHYFDASSDDQAVMEAIHTILDKSYEDKAGPWAIGAITLTDQNGNVLQSMDAK